MLQTKQNHHDINKVEEIYMSDYNTVLRIAHSILHDHYLAEDAVSSSIIKIIERIIVKSDENYCINKGLFIVIVKHTSLDILKHIKNKEMLPLDNFEYTLGNIDDMLLDDIIVSENNYDKICQCISRLSDSYADILSLKLIDHYLDDEIAVILGISKNYLYVRFHRAKKLLIQELIKKGIC